MSVTIADILGADGENNEEEVNKIILTREQIFEQAKNEALSRYNERVSELNDPEFNGGLVPIIAKDKDGEPYLFIVQIDRGEVTGIIFFALDQISEIFGTLMGVFNDFITDGRSN